MKLVIVDNDGEVHVVLIGLEGYDLTKPMARTEVVNQIADTLKELPKEDVSSPATETSYTEEDRCLDCGTLGPHQCPAAEE